MLLSFPCATEQGTWSYRTIKWLWLLLQALILPLAALHAVSPAVRWPLAFAPGMRGILPRCCWLSSAPLFLVFWLIAQALLSMARFPLTLKGGALLVGGTVAQFASLVASGGSLAAAAYAVFFATLAALIVACRHHGRDGQPPADRLAARQAGRPAGAAAGGRAGLVPGGSLRPAFSRLASGRQALEWLALALNAGLIVFSLYRFSIFAPPPDNDAAYTREWEKWAAPTIIILILSATTAIALAGFARSR